jgi:hypothetical protein
MKHWTMKVSGGVELQLYTFLILALDGQKLSATAPLPWVDETPVPMNKSLDAPQTSLDSFENRRIFCHCWEIFIHQSSSRYPNHYTDCTTVASCMGKRISIHDKEWVSRTESISCVLQLEPWSLGLQKPAFIVQWHTRTWDLTCLAVTGNMAAFPHFSLEQYLLTELYMKHSSYINIVWYWL